MAAGKVLMVVTQLNRGGMESRLMDILRKTDYSRVQIDIFTCRMEAGECDGEAKELGALIYYNRPLTVKNMHFYTGYFRDFLLGHSEYRIVHAQMNAWCSVFCKGAYMAGVPVRIAHSRTAVSGFSLKNICKNIIKKPCRHYATHFFAVSDKAGEWLFGKKLCRTGKVKVWKNAIDASAYRYDPQVRKKVREELNVPTDGFVLMHVGNFRPPKNHPFLIDVLEQVLGRREKAVLVLVGNPEAGPDWEVTQKKILGKKLGEKVLILGCRNDVGRLLQAADVFVFPSIFEGLPGAVVEAQAAGLPCVISDAVTEEAKLLETTRLLPLSDPIEVWRDAVCDAVSYPRKDTYGEIVAQGFDINELTENMMRFYEEVLKKDGGVYDPA